MASTSTSHPDPLAGSDLLQTSPSLLAGLGAEDPARSWDRFFRTYQGYILGCARARGLSEMDAQDVLQLVMLVVSREARGFYYDPSTRQFRSEGVAAKNGGLHQFARFRSWLKGLVQIKIWEVQRFLRRGGELLGEGPGDEVPDTAATPDEAAEQAHRRAMLAQAMAALRASYQGNTRNLEIFEAAFFREESSQSVAAKFGIEPNYVGVIVHTLKARLREILSRLLSGPTD
jgi:RNA polymerase sigma factor (sigma-70 family)